MRKVPCAARPHQRQNALPLQARGAESGLAGQAQQAGHCPHPSHGNTRNCSPACSRACSRSWKPLPWLVRIGLVLAYLDFHFDFEFGPALAIFAGGEPGQSSMLLRSHMFVQSPLALLPRSWIARKLQARHALTAAPGSKPEPSMSREYPDEPRVGVGVVILRKLDTPSAPGPEVVVIKRGKPPNLHDWSFPGGSLELGEVISGCAALGAGHYAAWAKARHCAPDHSGVRYSRSSRGNRPAAAQRHKPGTTCACTPGSSPSLHCCRRLSAETQPGE